MSMTNKIWALCADVAEDVLARLREENDPAALQTLPGVFNGLENTAKASAYAIKNGIAIIGISGPIDREARISWFTGEAYTAGQDQIRMALSEAMLDTSVKGIMLAINSPGGVVAGTKELADFIADCSKRKPCAAYADGMAASAAYWLAAATGNIYAPVTAQVGSIGVIAVLTDWTKAAGKAGITRTVIHSGKWKAAGSPDKELTDEERQLFQAQLESIHGIFAADVARYMNISASLPHNAEWAEGQTFLAADALALGLVSNIVQDMDGALKALSASIQNGDRLMNLAELKASHPELVAELAKEIQAEQDAVIQEAAIKARKEVLEIAAAVGGEDLAAKIGKVLESGVNASQLKTLAALFASSGQQSKQDPETVKRGEMLAALQDAHGAAINAGPDVAHKTSALVLDAERRSK